MTIDVAVVGGGPAGAWAAYKLAGAGARVTIFDASYPREKPCGGGITGRALALLSDVNGGLGSPVTIESARFEATGSPRTPVIALDRHGVTPRSALIVASRATFDRFLLDSAIARGARLIPERATDIECASHGATVTTTTGRHPASFLIGADGVTSLVRRRLSAPFGRHQLSIAAGYFAEGVTSRQVVIRCVSKPAGYIWSFPRPNHLAIGMCAQATAVRTARPLLETTLEWIGSSAIAPGARLVPYAWPIPSLSGADFEHDRFAGPRWLLAGDAAGLVDPLTREGIFYALRSGEIAAGALVAADHRAVHRYRDHIRQEIHPELRRAGRLSAGFFRPEFADLLLEALDTSSEIRQVMADLVAGRQTYLGLRRRLLSTREFRFAIRLVSLHAKSHFSR